MRYQLLVISGILLCPSLLHAQTPASAPAAPPPPGYLAPAQPDRDGAPVEPSAASVDRWYARPLALEGHLGVAAPLGFAGAAVDYSPFRWFGGGVGVGAGASGPQAAAMGRFRIPLAEGVGLGLGGGLSGGNYEWIEGGAFSVFIDKPASRMFKPAYWANADVSIEGRLEGGFTIRGYLGRAALLNPSDGQCAGDSGELSHCQTSHRVDGLALGYAGLAMGYAFAR